ncbi:putative hydro-lyase KRH_21160 [Lutra lutra]|uniref:putative hydro-lyase KRH_21160 n=1 Tax=Lutra lutra TaxID=9657 RepID=UPI001FD5FDE6|nr:putative hydro-lyase KRH_21160 [Lutra lutra]
MVHTRELGTRADPGAGASGGHGATLALKEPRPRQDMLWGTWGRVHADRTRCWGHGATSTPTGVRLWRSWGRVHADRTRCGGRGAASTPTGVRPLKPRRGRRAPWKKGALCRPCGFRGFVCGAVASRGAERGAVGSPRPGSDAPRVAAVSARHGLGSCGSSDRLGAAAPLGLALLPPHPGPTGPSRVHTRRGAGRSPGVCRARRAAPFPPPLRLPGRRPKARPASSRLRPGCGGAAGTWDPESRRVCRARDLAPTLSSRESRAAAASCKDEWPVHAGDLDPAGSASLPESDAVSAPATWCHVGVGKCRVLCGDLGSAGPCRRRPTETRHPRTQTPPLSLPNHVCRVTRAASGVLPQTGTPSRGTPTEPQLPGPVLADNGEALHGGTQGHLLHLH